MSSKEPKKGEEPAKKEGSVWTYEDKRTRIVVNRAWCKGCEICVEFCPKATLALENNKSVVCDLKTCSHCLMCELRCPDFAIEVFDLSKAKGGESDMAKVTSAQKPADDSMCTNPDGKDTEEG